MGISYLIETKLRLRSRIALRNIYCGKDFDYKHVSEFIPETV
jgi:hypothetical protein